MKTYDYIFVLPAVPISYVGGYKLIYLLSDQLSRLGMDVGILFLSDSRRYVYSVHRDMALWQSIRSREHTIESVLNVMMCNRIGYRILRPLVRLLHTQSIPSGLETPERVDILFDLPKVQVERLVATSWETAYYVNRFVGARNKYYLIQAEEDSPAFSGRLAPLARSTYGFPLHKIVNNQKLQERFEPEGSALIHVCWYVGYRNTGLRHVARKKANTVLVPLRKSPSKGAKYAVSAIQLMRRRDPTISFVAFGDYHGAVPSFVKFFRRPTDEKLAQLYELAEIFVLPSVTEGFSSPALEAMAAGCAIVATDSGGPSMYIRDSINGLIVPVQDSQAIADAVMSLFHNPHLRERIAMNGVRTASEYTYSRTFSEFLGAIRGFEGGTMVHAKEDTSSLGREDGGAGW
ncbi:MAG: glycosyltransferase family 4 protein [Nitrososphaerota archaeon]|nr:glycosyltransferase family 4 protein [Nitrososphaerota archaeon]